MLKHKIKYTDFNGQDREDTLYFNLTEFDIVEMQAESKKGIEVDFKEAIANKDTKGMLDFIKMVIHRSYGEKSPDGKYHEKSPEITQRFVNSALYSDLLMDLFSDGGKRGATFIHSLMPASLIDKAAARMESAGGTIQDVVATNDGFQVQAVQPSARERMAEFRDQKDVDPRQEPPVTEEDLAELAEFRRQKALRAQAEEVRRPVHETGEGYQV